VYLLLKKAKDKRKRVRDGGRDIEGERQSERNRGKETKYQRYRDDRDWQRDREIEAERRKRGKRWRCRRPKIEGRERDRKEGERGEIECVGWRKKGREGDRGKRQGGGQIRRDGG
jgi:hypothetical protein